MGNLYNTQGDLKQAILYYQKSIVIVGDKKLMNEENALNNYNLGLCYMKDL